MKIDNGATEDNLCIRKRILNVESPATTRRSGAHVCAQHNK